MLGSAHIAESWTSGRLVEIHVNLFPAGGNVAVLQVGSTVHESLYALMDFGHDGGIRRWLADCKHEFTTSITDGAPEIVVWQITNAPENQRFGGQLR